MKTIEVEFELINEGIPGKEDMVPVSEADGTVFETFFSVDWKENPYEVMEAINTDLKERGINLQYVYLEDGSDAFHFAAEKTDG